MRGRNCRAPSRLTVKARNLVPMQKMAGIDPHGGLSSDRARITRHLHSGCQLADNSWR